jgi:hypothetical protein
MICLFHQPTNPTRRIFFGEKAILEESNEPSHPVAQLGLNIKKNVSSLKPKTEFRLN